MTTSKLVAYHVLQSGQEIISLFNAKGGTGYGAELDLDYQLGKSLRLSVNMGYVQDPHQRADRNIGSAPAGLIAPTTGNRWTALRVRAGVDGLSER